MPQVRRAYKRLALQLHPDKAASAVRLAPRCAGRGSPLYEAAAAAQRLQERATWLFKLLGEPGWLALGLTRGGVQASLPLCKLCTLHPPTHPPPSHPPIPSPGEANEVLSDASKRRELDHALRCAAASSRGSASPFGASSSGFGSYGGGGYGAYGAGGYGTGYGGGGYGGGYGGFGSYSSYGAGSDEDEGFGSYFGGRRYGSGGGAGGARGGASGARGGSGRSGYGSGGGGSSRYWGFY